jgi:GMP synthase-like glutamine amidotransferase
MLPRALSLQQACAGELPTAEEAARFDAIIVAGSHYSAYEQHEWIEQLMVLLRKLAGQGTRMYGCCFGCQVCVATSMVAKQPAAGRVVHALPNMWQLW